MWRCKHVSDALYEKDYKELSFWKRIGLIIHVRLCFFCGKHNRQIMRMQDACRHFADEEPKLPEKGPTMDNDFKEALKQKMQQEQKL